MFCASCGTQLPDGMAFCTNCGQATAGVPAPTPAPAATAPPPAPAWQPAPSYGYGAPSAGGDISVASMGGTIFMVLGMIAAIVATFLSFEEAYLWSAGIFLLAAILFILGGVFYAQGRRRPPMAAAPPAWPPAQPPYGPPQQPPGSPPPGPPTG